MSVVKPQDDALSDQLTADPPDELIKGGRGGELVAAGHVRAKMSSILASHSLVDVYSAFVPALLGLLEVRCQLSIQQSATLLGVGSVCSGLAQPLAAWFNDRYNSRATAPIGLGLCAAALCLIGWVTSYSALLLLYAVGMFCSGMFHPAAAATMGHLGGRRRSLGVSLFFVAGMTGWAAGNLLAPRLAILAGGFRWLPLCMIPGVIVAVILFRSLRGVSHREREHDRVEFAPSDVKQRWWMVGCLFVAASIRFSVNMALMFLCVRYVQSLALIEHPTWAARQIAEVAAPRVGNLNAMLILGMGIGGLSSGLVLPAGREKWPMVCIPILFSPAIYFLPHHGIGVAYGLSVLAGIGFASMIPISMAVAQRLLPHRTSMASAITLGGAWTLAFLGPMLAGLGIERVGIETTYAYVALALFLSGITVLPLKSALIRVPSM